ncbi:hypothetical protein DSO57_1022154 [Entomophthora muscae]|nr:hypothetical protein DSO57_1022154 [Entomophthora muscae]
MRLMEGIRKSIICDEFPAFVRKFMKGYYSKEKSYPEWILNALRSVNIELEPFST